MKTGSKYIHTDGMRMELWIMTAWLADNHLLTCLTHSWTVCLPAWLLLSTYFFASLLFTSAAMYPHACVSTFASPFLAVFFVLYSLLMCKSLPQPDSLPSLSSFHIICLFFFIYCLCFSSSTFIGQTVQCNLLSLHRELSCIERLKAADGKKERDRVWEICK